MKMKEANFMFYLSWPPPGLLTKFERGRQSATSSLAISISERFMPLFSQLVKRLTYSELRTSSRYISTGLLIVG